VTVLKALVIGGTGPTGPHIIEGLRSRGYEVAMLNRGVHRIPMPNEVEQIVGDPHFAEPLRQALGSRSFDLVVATYGRLKVTAEVLAGRAGRFVGVGGVAAYRGFMDPLENFPSGHAIPFREDAPLARPGDNKFENLIVAAERALFEFHPTATHFRYPYVYGPRQVAPREWSLVRRVLDGRRTIVVMHGGLGLNSHLFAENAAHALMLAVDQPEMAAGKIYNCADDDQFDQRQLIEIGARALGVELDVVSIPNVESAHGALLQVAEYHRFADTSLIRAELGYRDVTPALEAIAQTVLWYRDNPLERGGEYEQRRKDVFDYEAEDRLIALFRQFEAGVKRVTLRPLHENYAMHPYAHPEKSALGRDQRGR
jgi:nucleoside-diphosphate-sugar epimerase